MDDVDSDNDYFSYIREHSVYAPIYFRQSGAHRPDYILEGSSEEEEEVVEQVDRSSVGQGLQSDELLPRVVQDHGATTSSQDDASIANIQSSGNATEGGEMNENEGMPGGEKWDRNEADGLFCPICMEAWTSGGNHQICCLPCGHIYGMSCIKRWLQQSRSQGKCPQCNKKCTLKSIRVLYASHIAVIDEGLQQKVQTLETKCTSLEKRDGDWRKKEDGWQKREVDLCMQVNHLRERTRYLELLVADIQRRPSGLVSAMQDDDGYPISGPSFETEVGQGCLNRFLMLKEWQIDGARFFDVDPFCQTMVIAQRLFGMGGSHMLTKISLLAPHDRENIQLPPSIKAVKDLRVSPHAKLALLASSGKKLSVISTESNNTILTYDLSTAAWSCTWDPSNCHYVYTGLQNGMVLKFDLRQTVRPVESIAGLTSNPVHSIQCLSTDLSLGSGTRSVLTASSVGLCHWNFGSSGGRPFLVPESADHGVCISLAYGPHSDDIVASFRPKIEMSGDGNSSQAQPSFSSSILGQVVLGCHVFYKRTGSRYQKLGSGCANVNDIRLPRSVLIDSVNHKSLFVSGDEVMQDLVLQELPSFIAFQRLNTQKHPIWDLKYSRVLNKRLLGCLSGDRLQLFSTER